MQKKHQVKNFYGFQKRFNSKHCKKTIIQIRVAYKKHLILETVQIVLESQQFCECRCKNVPQFGSTGLQRNNS